MRSRIGFKPNGTLLLKDPAKHFQESEFVKAVDKWSVNMKDNPLPHFAAKIKVKQVNVFPYYGFSSTRKYEDRSARTVREYANPDRFNRMPAVSWNAVNLWNYNLKEQDKDFSVVLEDTVYSQGCQPCGEAGKVVVRCSSCAGRGHTYETDYSNNTRRSVRCGSCMGSGDNEETCRTCDGHGGFVNYVMCDVHYSYPSTKSFYCDDQVRDILNSLNFENAAFDLYSEVNTAAELVNFVQGEIKEAVTADIISFVNSHDKEHQHFLGEKTLYGQAYFSLVRFEYDNGREYTIAIYGDNDFVYAPESPISQSAEKILDEANEFLQAHDFKGASPVLQMINNTGLRRDILVEIVNRFQTNLALAHKHLASDTKNEIQRATLKFHAKSLGDKNIKDAETFPFITEIISGYVIPLAVAIGLHTGARGFNSDFAINALFLGSVSFATYFMYSRKKNKAFNKIWKYGIMSLVSSWVTLATTDMLRNDPMWIAIIMNALITLVGASLTGLLSDRKLEVPHTQGSEKFDKLLELYKPNLSSLKKYFPRDEFSYIDDEKKKDYQVASRNLDETLRESSEDEEMNLIDEGSEEKQAA